jgi:hypothetical protein
MPQEQIGPSQAQGIFALACELDYQECVSIVNRIPGPFEVGQAFQPDMASESVSKA